MQSLTFVASMLPVCFVDKELTIHILLYITVNNSIVNTKRHFETDKKIKTLIYVISIGSILPPPTATKAAMETFLSSLLVYFLSLWQA